MLWGGREGSEEVEGEDVSVAEHCAVALRALASSPDGRYCKATQMLARFAYSCFPTRPFLLVSKTMMDVSVAERCATPCPRVCVARRQFSLSLSFSLCFSLSHTHIHARTRARTYTRTHARTHTHTHTHTVSAGRLPSE